MGNLRESLGNAGDKLLDAGAGLLKKGVTVTSSGTDEMLRTLGAQYYLTSHIIEGSILPATDALLEMNRDTTRHLLDLLSRDEKPAAVARALGKRVWSGTRYARLMNRLGKDLFGSARYEGEKVIAENNFFRLSYLPPKPGVEPQETALFHAGGFIPYGDQLFRLLPEANFFDRFLERGLPVYAMELKPKGEIKRFGSLTMEGLIGMIDDMTEAAFQHNAQRKMVIEGYCGTTMPMLCFVAAKPRQADARLKAIMTMVAPIDGTRCPLFYAMQKFTPQSVTFVHLALSHLLVGYVHGINLWAGLDVALKNVFPKTPMGRFTAGWKNSDYARVKTIDDLSPAQRFELTGAYWISIENCIRFPIPVGILRFHNKLFNKGITEDGEIPCDYRGRRLHFKTILDETQLPIISFYGELDRMVPDATAHVLKKVFGKRYRHVVHKHAGHVSYIFTPSVWQPDQPRALDPNPIDVLLRASTFVPRSP